MTFIHTYAFKADVPKPALIDFISRTPPESFLFLVTDEPVVYGLLVSGEVLEFFTNEFPVRSLEIVPEETLRLQMMRKTCKVWGNKDLLYFRS